MTGKAKIKVADIPRIKLLYLQGRTCSYIGKLFGISPARVGTILRNNGVQTRYGNSGRNKSEVAERHSKIKELYQAGYTLENIAEQLNISKGTVSYVLYIKPKKYNITERKNMSFTETAEKEVIMAKFAQYLKELKEMGINHDQAAVTASNLVQAELFQYFRNHSLSVDGTIDATPY